MLGYHAKVGTVRGILAHTYVGGLISEIRLNGIPVGEAELNAAIAGYYGVPVVLVSGDNTLADATKISLPWAEQVITKWALSPLAARSNTPKLSQKLIFDASEKALAVLSKTKPFVIESPISMEIDFLKTPPAFLASDIPGVTLQNGRSVVFTAENILEAFKYIRIMVNMAFGDYWL